jgi:hypothetical protein
VEEQKNPAMGHREKVLVLVGSSLPLGGVCMNSIE